MIAVADEPIAEVEGEDGRDKRPGRKSAPVQIEKELARMAAVIAAHDGKTLSEFLSPYLKQYIETHYARVIREGTARVQRRREEQDQKKDQKED